MGNQREVQRASDQVDRQVEQQRRTNELIEGLDDDNPDTAESSEKTLSAMSSPQHDDNLTAGQQTRGSRCND